MKDYEIICPKCPNVISSLDTTCPHCGEEVEVSELDEIKFVRPKTEWIIVNSIWIAGLFLWYLVVILIDWPSVTNW